MNGSTTALPNPFGWFYLPVIHNPQEFVTGLADTDVSKIEKSYQTAKQARLNYNQPVWHWGRQAGGWLPRLEAKQQAVETALNPVLNSQGSSLWDRLWNRSISTPPTDAQIVSQLLQTSLLEVDEHAEAARELFQTIINNEGDELTSLRQVATQLRIDPSDITKLESFQKALTNLANAVDSSGSNTFAKQFFGNLGLKFVDKTWQVATNAGLSPARLSAAVLDNLVGPLSDPRQLKKVLQNAVNIGFVSEIESFHAALASRVAIRDGGVARGGIGYLANQALNRVQGMLKRLPYGEQLARFFTGSSTTAMADNLAHLQTSLSSFNALQNITSWDQFFPTLGRNIKNAVGPSLRAFCSGWRIPFVTTAIALSLNDRFKGDLAQAIGKAARFNLGGAFGHLFSAGYEASKYVVSDLATLILTGGLGVAGTILGGPLGFIAAMGISTAINAASQGVFDLIRSVATRKPQSPGDAIQGQNVANAGGGGQTVAPSKAVQDIIAQVEPLVGNSGGGSSMNSPFDSFGGNSGGFTSLSGVP